MAGRCLRLCALGLVLALCAPGIAAAQNGPGDWSEGAYPVKFRLRWKPHRGWTETIQRPTNKKWDHKVKQVFKWQNSLGTSRLDAPRTPKKHGTYEHELRFRTYDGQRWCTRQKGIAGVIHNLPKGSYHDDVAGQPRARMLPRRRSG